MLKIQTNKLRLLHQFSAFWNVAIVENSTAYFKAIHIWYLARGN